MAEDYDRMDPSGGVFATVEEFWKNALGSQDAASELRRRFNKIRINEGLKNLPPGPATDKDVQLALEGVPPKGASREQVKSFLKGASRLSNIAAAYNQFKSQYISDKGNTRGMIGEWKKEHTISNPQVIDKYNGKNKFSMAEIYETSIIEGIPVQQIMSILGVE